MSLRPRFLEAKSNLFCHFLTLRLLYLGRKSDSQGKGNLKIQNGSFGLPFFASTNELTPKKATLFSESAALGCLFLLVRLVPPRKRQPFLQKAAKKVAFSQKYQRKPRFWEKGLYFSRVFRLRASKNTNANGAFGKKVCFFHGCFVYGRQIIPTQMTNTRKGFAFFAAVSFPCAPKTPTQMGLSGKRFAFFTALFFPGAQKHQRKWGFWKKGLLFPG